MIVATASKVGARVIDGVHGMVPEQIHSFQKYMSSISSSSALTSPYHKRYRSELELNMPYGTAQYGELS